MKKTTRQLFCFLLAVTLLLGGCIQIQEASDVTSPKVEEISPDVSAEASTERPTETTAEKTTEKTPETTVAPSTEAPTEKPTEPPTEAPTEKPTEPPTEAPTEKPTEPPTEAPTEKPTEPPTEPPTEAPTEPPVMPPENEEKIKIDIDQGHNPHTVNAGAEGNGLREQDITYKVGILLAELLRADGRFEVCLSRPTAETMLGTTQTESLAARANGANEWGADYFISIHANAHTTSTAHGIEAFSYSKESGAYLLGEKIVDALVHETGLENRGMKTRTDLYVLRNTVMPAVLVELGFITNPTEAAMMNDRPELFAKGIYDGIVAHLSGASSDKSE